MRRRTLLKSASIAAASLSVGPKAVVGSRGQNSLEELEKDFQRHTQKHGNVAGYEKFVSGSEPGDSLHVTQGKKKSKSLRPNRTVKTQTNRATDLFKFEDGSTEELEYFVKDENTIVARWDGNTYQTRSTDPLGKELFDQGRAVTDQNTAGTEKKARATKQGEKLVTTQSREFIDDARRLSDGRADDSGLLGGISKTRSRYETDECGAVVQSGGVARGWAKAEVYSEVDLTDLSWNSVAEIRGEGWYRGAVGSGLSAGHARGELFVRDTGDSWAEDDIDSERFVDLSLGLIDSWGDHSSYDTTLLTELDPGTYEVGVRIDLSGMNLGVSASMVNFHDKDGLDYNFPGYVDNTYIAVYER